jgi:hypothetical protein
MPYVLCNAINKLINKKVKRYEKLKLTIASRKDEWGAPMMRGASSLLACRPFTLTLPTRIYGLETH